MLPPLRFYDSFTRELREFVPQDPTRVSLYLCGPTVYDSAHVGNARTNVLVDVLFRLLRKLYGAGSVCFTRNITDVDDKIIERARAEGRSTDLVTQETTASFHQDMAAIGNLAPTFEPKATEYMVPMIALIEKLLAKGHAYQAQSHVLFSVPSYPDYGALSRHSKEDIIAGARVDVAPYKKDPSDFVLWKSSDNSQPGWESPWGRGRPGWHIECSAMARDCLGKTVDIHAGGRDLIFPHHENEIAQSVCAYEQPLSHYWFHVGMLNINGKKMSKSLGNYFTVHELMEEGFRGEVLRLALLAGHYRQPLDFRRKSLAEAKSQLDRFYRATEKLAPDGDKHEEEPEGLFWKALADDVNTPEALSRLHGLAGEALKGSTEAARLLKAAGNNLGLLEQSSEDWFQAGTELNADEIEKLVADRLAARQRKDFAESDRIREALAARGIALEDGAEGTRWRRQ